MSSPENSDNPPRSNDQPSDWDSLGFLEFTPYVYSLKNNDLKDDRTSKSIEYKKNQHLANLKRIEDMSHLSPAEQLKQLSDFWEKAESDIGFAMSGGKDLFYIIDGNTKFSPFIQLVARAAKSTNPYDSSDYGHRDSSHDYNIGENHGYDYIVRPLPYTDDPEIDNFDEEKLKTEIEHAKKAEQNSSISEPPRPYGDWYSYILTLELALEHIYFTRNQEKLHQEFPSLVNGNQLIKIAPDAAISVDFQEKYDSDIPVHPWSGSLNMLSDDNGYITSMTEVENGKPNSLNLDKDILTYLEAVHCNPDVKNVIEKALNLKITEIPLASQIQLLKFMTEADSSRYNNLCQTLKNTPSILRKKLAEAFLAADFGPDFGDSLLAIANSDRFTPDQVADILTSIDSCRSSIKDISSLYSGINDGAFTEQYSRAANERLTDAITVFREIAEHGEASADLNWTGHPTFTYEDAIETLNYEAKSLFIISSTMDNVISGKDGAFAEQILSPDAEHNRSLYNFYSPDHGYVLLYTRPEGSSIFDPTIEYGKFRSIFSEQNRNAGVEASISFIVNPINPFSLPNPYRPDYRKSRDPNYYDPATMDKVSAIRLDREGRAPNTPPDDPNRSPIAEVGTISVDLAAIGDRADTPSGKIARLFSTGNKLREQSHNTDFNLNHNTHWFNQETYGTASGFEALVDYIQDNADILCLIAPPSKNSPSLSSAARSTRQRSPRHRNLRPAA